MDPPIQTEYFRSGGATILTCVAAIRQYSDGKSEGGETNLHGGRSKSGDFLLHSVRDTSVPVAVVVSEMAREREEY